MSINEVGLFGQNHTNLLTRMRDCREKPHFSESFVYNAYVSFDQKWIVLSVADMNNELQSYTNHPMTLELVGGVGL